MRKTSILGIIVSLFLLISCLFIVFPQPGRAEERDIYVNIKYPYLDGDGTADHPYRTIRKALDEAEDGDNIYIFEGTYNETFVIDKQISLIGLDRDNVTIEKRGKISKYFIKVQADHVTLEDFTVSDSHNYNSFSLIYISSDYITIEGTNITKNNNWGIYLDSSSDNTIGNNIINQTKGLRCYNSNNNVYSNNIFENCDDASINLISSDNAIVYSNSFNQCEYGILGTSSSNSNITNNNIDSCSAFGIKLSGGNNNRIRSNFINDSAKGIYLNSADSFINENQIKNCQEAILLHSSNCKIKNNSIINSNIIGVETYTTSRNNIFYLNYFKNNIINAEENGKNQWFFENQGNYWDDYNNIDEDLDGVGDFPYELPGGGIDMYPLGLFLKPPEKPVDPSPEDEEDDVGLAVTFTVTVSDPDSDELTVHFYDAATDALLGTVYHVPSEDIANYVYHYPFETTVLWYAVVSDGKLSNRSDIWIFTTRQIPPTNKKPVADPGRPYYAMIGEEITLDGSGSEDPDGEIEFYRWDFGDGSSEILAISPKHTYYDPGTYTVTLTVVDDDGRSSTEQTTATISTTPVTNYPPFADPGGPYSGEVEESITFNGTGSEDTDGTIMTYNWNFGDDTNSSGVLVSHTYSNEGTYLVELTVTDDGGASHSSSVVVTIDPKSGIPGFELIIVIFAITSIFLYYKRKR